MSERTFTAYVDVSLKDWTDEEIQEEANRRGLSMNNDFGGVDEEELKRWADLLRAGKEATVINEFRTALRDKFGLAFL
jgi:hypothetical protein